MHTTYKSVSKTMKNCTCSWYYQKPQTTMIMQPLKIQHGTYRFFLLKQNLICFHKNSKIILRLLPTMCIHVYVLKCDHFQTDFMACSYDEVLHHCATFKGGLYTHKHISPFMLYVPVPSQESVFNRF